jgi:cytochrome c-type biogenesis protein CcmE
MKWTNLLLLGALAGLFGMLLYSMTDSFSKYADFGTAERIGSDVHVVGTWVNREDAFYDPQRDEFVFWMADTLDRVERVVFPDPKPMNFETAQRLVIIGKYNGQHFEANKILMKCPSKYKNDELETYEAEAS